MIKNTNQQRVSGMFLITIFQITLWTANIFGYNHYSGLDSIAFSVLMIAPFLILSVINAFLLVQHLIRAKKRRQELDRMALVAMGLLIALVLASPTFVS